MPDEWGVFRTPLQSILARSDVSRGTIHSIGGVAMGVKKNVKKNIGGQKLVKTMILWVLPNSKNSQELFGIKKIINSTFCGTSLACLCFGKTLAVAMTPPYNMPEYLHRVRSSGAHRP